MALCGLFKTGVLECSTAGLQKQDVLQFNDSADVALAFCFALWGIGKLKTRKKSFLIDSPGNITSSDVLKYFKHAFTWLVSMTSHHSGITQENKGQG